MQIPDGWQGPATIAILQACCAAMFMDPQSTEAATLFRDTWPDGETNAAPPPDQDVCYCQVTERDDPTVASFGAPTEDGYQESQTIPLSCQFIFYGPNAARFASFLRLAMFRDVYEKKSGTEYPPPMAVLRAAGLVILPNPDYPVRLPEKASGVWRNRCDLTLHFNLLLEIPHMTDGVEVPPEIIMTTNLEKE